MRYVGCPRVSDWLSAVLTDASLMVEAVGVKLGIPSVIVLAEFLLLYLPPKGVVKNRHPLVIQGIYSPFEKVIVFLPRGQHVLTYH